MDFSKLHGKTIRVRGALILFVLIGCASLPKIQHEKYVFPSDEAFVGKPNRPFKIVGEVKSKVDFPNVDPAQDDQSLCRNYYNKAVGRLVKYAKKAGGDAVMEIRSIVFLMDGKVEAHESAECVDEGGEGQVLTRGLAIKWVTK